MHVQSCGSRNVLMKDVYRVKNRLQQSVQNTTYLEKRIGNLLSVTTLDELTDAVAVVFAAGLD